MNRGIHPGERVRYWIDNSFSKGIAALIAWLGVISLIIILIAAGVLALTGFNQEGAGGGLSFGEAAWEALMRTFDAGTMGGDTGWGFRLVMLFVTVGGIFVISTLIGVLSNGVEGKLEELRKGRSRVIENGHTVILGWSEQIFTILSELIIANENQKRSCIVILAEKDKVEMEDAIRDRIGETGKTTIVCRTGVPIELGDLKIASLDTSRSIIVLSPESEDPDAEVIKTVLAITRHPERRGQPYHIVAELHDLKNAEVARVASNGEVEWIMTGDLVARIIAQTCRQSGLSVVYNELLDFGGDEIYFTHLPELAGKTYAEVLDKFEKNAVMGVAWADGTARLNPAMDAMLGEGDQLVVIAADDDQIFFQSEPRANVQRPRIACRQTAEAIPEKTLILGWNWRGPAILRELDGYVTPGSQVLVLAGDENLAGEVRECASRLINQSLEALVGDSTDRAVLESLGFDGFDHVILLSCLERLSAQQADSRTLISLLHLRDIADKNNLHFSITSEMLDVRNRNLAEVTRADDFIVSGRLISLMLAQIAENKRLNAVFGDLFDPEGSEVYLKPVEDYLVLGQPVNYYTVLEAARQRGETAIGYRKVSLAKDAAASYGVVLNPAKSLEVDFQPGDKIIVLAES
jgi:voltage-gated potassium channel Kch